MREGPANTAMIRVMPPSVSASRNRSALSSPYCGRAVELFSTITATGRVEEPGVISATPVRGFRFAAGDSVPDVAAEIVPPVLTVAEELPPDEDSPRSSLFPPQAASVSRQEAPSRAASARTAECVRGCEDYAVCFMEYLFLSTITMQRRPSPWLFAGKKALPKVTVEQDRHRPCPAGRCGESGSSEFIITYFGLEYNPPPKEGKIRV